MSGKIDTIKKNRAIFHKVVESLIPYVDANRACGCDGYMDFAIFIDHRGAYATVNTSPNSNDIAFSDYYRDGVWKTAYERGLQ